MKNQIKITLALLVMLTLNACGTAPITVNPDNSGDDKKTSAICTTNPFDASCGDAFQAERDVVIGECRINGIDDICLSATASVCRTNPFDTLCSFTFNTARDIITTECRKDDTGTLCPQAIARVCLANAFDAVCGDAYDDVRETTCRRDSSHSRCMETLSKICNATPFDSLCNDNSIYEDMRKANCIMGANSNTAICTRIFTTNSCVRKPFNSGCDNEITARNAREAFCRESGNATNSLCVGAVSHFCGVSVFDGLCGSSYEPMRIADCIIAGNAGETRCTGAFTTGSCVLNPFGANCDSESYLSEARVNRVNFCSADKTGSNLCTQVIRDCLSDPFGESCRNNLFENARASRISLCSDSETSGDSLCMNINACHINPFSVSCVSMTTYDDDRDERLIYCRENDDNNLCTNAITVTCIATGNPFDALCDDSQYQPLRTQRLDFCGMQDNKDNATCAVVLSRPNIASFLQSFDAPLPVLSDAENKHGFLQGTATGLNLGSVTDIDLRALNLATGDGDQSLGGDSVDGVAFFSRNVNSTYYYFAGIFSGTDLGARLTETEGTAMWNGRFRAIGNNDSVNKNFILNINFGAGDQAGTISASVQVSTSYNSRYSLTGNFDSSGVIRGDIEYLRDRFSTGGGGINSKTPGRLRGLIGQEGAVGVFIINNDGIGSYRYSGGFVARPPSE